MSKRKTSLQIVKDDDGSFLITVKFSDKDGYPKKDSEVIRELIGALDDSPFGNWINSKE